jgi:hypothetical protein
MSRIEEGSGAIFPIPTWACRKKGRTKTDRFKMTLNVIFKDYI